MQIIHWFVFYFHYAYSIRLSDVTKTTIWPPPLQSICKYSNAYIFHIFQYFSIFITGSLVKLMAIQAGTQLPFQRSDCTRLNFKILLALICLMFVSTYDYRVWYMYSFNSSAFCGKEIIKQKIPQLHKMSEFCSLTFL